jgi:hypothetical protein
MIQWKRVVRTVVVVTIILSCASPLTPTAFADATNAPRPALTQIQFLEITIPVPTGLLPALRPPIATYVWHTLLGSPDPVDVRWIFIPTAWFNYSWTETEDYIRNTPGAPEWSAWQPYSPPDVGTFWTNPAVDFGQYVFAVQGRDGVGNVDEDFTLDRNMRRILVALRATGPILTVTGQYIAPIITSTTQTPVTQIGLPSGTPVSFCWTADASSYGGVVAGYRYGWDLIDPNDDEQWEIPFTPFGNPQECSPVRTFFFGVHVFYVEVIDNDGFKSRVPIQITYMPGVPVEHATWGNIKARYE